MRKCRRCSKPATLHITEIQGGEAQAVHLCETCAQDYLGGVDDSDDDSDMPGLAEKLSQFSDEDDFGEDADLTCPNCGISFAEFRNKGRLGCPHDYVAFEKQLIPLLENIHGETEHVGKFPRRAPDASRRQCELIRLRNELRGSVEQEDYEAAASLRDKIKELEADIDAQASE